MAERPKEFINPVQHISFVHGNEQVDFLKARHAGMAAHHFFREMEYTTDRAKIASWAPLLLEGRGEVPIAATKTNRIVTTLARMTPVAEPRRHPRRARRLTPGSTDEKLAKSAGQASDVLNAGRMAPALVAAAGF